MAKTSKLPDPTRIMATRGPILRWLATKSPRSIVARDMYNWHECLGSTFLRARGFEGARCVFMNFEYANHAYPVGPEVSVALRQLAGPFHAMHRRPITAARAIRALKAA